MKGACCSRFSMSCYQCTSDNFCLPSEIFEKRSCLTNFNYGENVKLKKKNSPYNEYVLNKQEKKLLLARRGCGTGTVISRITVNDFVFLVLPVNRIYTKEIKSDR